MARSEFEGRVAWVTGASAGIGRELARELARRGAAVAVSARREDRLGELAQEISRGGGRALAVACDVTDEAQVAAAADRVATELGSMDVAIANAGFAVNGPFDSLSPETWRRQLEVNVLGVVLTARAALPQLRGTRGRLALVGSVSAMVSTPGGAAYCASKAAVRALGQTLSLELHGSGVSCTTVHPGFVASEIGQVDNEGRLHPDWKDRRPQALMWPADRAARALLDAVERRRREAVITGHGKLAAWVGRHAPGLLHFAITRTGGRR
jgi:NAD(P)-dependent dehydrogenase (short-subunit alcohol dehydrogenase family)